MTRKGKSKVLIITLLIISILAILSQKAILYAATTTFSIGTNVEASFNSTTQELTISSTSGIGIINENAAQTISNNVGLNNIKTLRFANPVTTTTSFRSLFNFDHPTNSNFYSMENLTEIKNMSNLDTSRMTDMRDMFRNCNSLKNLDLSGFDTSKVTNMEGMFDCASLESVDLSSFDTSKVTNMARMFTSPALTNLDVTNFNTSSVTDMNNMFSNCSSLTSLDVTNFDTSNVTNMVNMFSNCSSLTSLDVTNFNTSNVTNMALMFRGCSSLTSLDVTNFDTANVSSMMGMFNGCRELTNLNVTNFDTVYVRNMSEMFSGCSHLTSLDVSNFNTTRVTNMSSMFYNCSSISSLDISNFNMRFVTNTDNMLKYMTKLNHLYTPSQYSTSQIDLPSTYVNLTDISDTNKYTSFTSSDFSGTVHLAKYYSIMYRANGGTGDEMVQDGYIDKNVTIYDNEFTPPEGKRFASWNTLPNGNGTTYNPGDTHIIKNSFNLYAQWEDATYTVTFKDGDDIVDTQTVENGAGATAPNISKPGYTLSWDKDFSHITENTTVNAVWTPKTNTPYKVEHYKEQPDGSFVKDNSLTENKTGTTGTTATAVAKNIPGYTEDVSNSNRVPSGTIAGDGSLVLKLYYKANTNTPYTVEHYKEQPDGSFVKDNSLTENKSGKTGATATATPKTIPGYTEDVSNSNRVPSGVISADGNLVLKLYYKANTNTPYTVEHYKEQPDGSFIKDNSLTENKTGTTGTTATAVAKNIPGYTEDVSNSNRVPSGTIAGDGSLVLKLYYKANTNTPYKVEHYIEQPDGSFLIDNSLTENKSGKTGATATATPKTILGYSEDTTNSNRVPSGTILGDGSLVLKLYYKANTDTQYKIEYYLRNLDEEVEGYNLERIDNKEGTTNTIVTAEEIDFPGFTYDPTNTNNVPSGTVTADGKLVLKLYYNRDRYNINYVLNGGNAKGLSNSYIYGRELPLGKKVTKQGYQFAGWYDNEELQGSPITKISATDTGDKTFYAKWIDAEEEYYILSEKYDIEISADNSENYITKVSPNTNVETFLSNIETNGVPEVVNKNGQKVENGQLVGTGCKLKVTWKGEVYEYEIAVRGDINGDGKVTVTDLSMMNQTLVGKINLTGINKKAADLDNNKKITVTDLSVLNQAIVGKIQL